MLLKHGDAIVFGGTRKNRAFVDHDITGFQEFPDGLRGTQKRRQVGSFVKIDRSWNGDDIDRAIGDVGRVGRV